MANILAGTGINVGQALISQKGDGKKRIKARIPANSVIHLLGNYRIKEYS